MTGNPAYAGVLIIEGTVISMFDGEHVRECSLSVTEALRILRLLFYLSNYGILFAEEL